MTRVAGVVLAAGGATRMGAPKQLLAIAGVSLVRRAVQAVLASRCDPVFVVVGAHAAAVADEIRERPVRVVENAAWAEGLASSIRVGIVAATAAGADGVLLAVGDQPGLTSTLLDDLIAALDGAPTGLVAATYAGTLGVPALFDRRHFAALRALTGDRGAQAILVAHADTVVRVAFPAGAIDVDTPADLARARALLPDR